MNDVNDGDSFFSFVNGLDISGEKVSQIIFNRRVESLRSVRSAWLKLVP